MIVEGFQLFARNWRRQECLNIIDQNIQDNIISNNNKHMEYSIVTGHHLDDQVESFLFKLFRGTHLSNLTPV